MDLIIITKSRPDTINTRPRRRPSVQLLETDRPGIEARDNTSLDPRPLRNVDLNKRAANYLRVLIFAILLSFAEIAEINTRENMSLILRSSIISLYTGSPFSFFVTFVQ